MRSRTEALRALTLETALQLDLAEHAGDEATRTRALGCAQFLLPVCKAWTTDTAFDIANEAIQVFGGHGYIRDSGVEQYVRDIRVAGIYEGTNGIQALDLVMRKLIADRAERLTDWLARMGADAAAPADTELAPVREALAQGVASLRMVSEELVVRGTRRSADAAAGATAYLRLCGTVGGAWMWLRMARAATGTGEFHRMKRRLALWYAREHTPLIELLARHALAGSDVGPPPSADEWLAGV